MHASRELKGKFKQALDAQCVLHILLARCLACFFPQPRSCTECTQVVNLQNDSASKPDWRLNIWSGDQKWRNGNKHRKYLEKYLQRKYLEKYLHKKYLKIYLHKKLDYFCNLTLSMALYKSFAISWTGIITSQPNPIMRKSEIWYGTTTKRGWNIS